MLDAGYIRLYRSLLSWEWYDDINTKTLFLHILLTVNYEDKEWHGVIIKRGQRVCSIGKLAAETHLSTQSVRTSLNRLKSTCEITSLSNPQYTVITVLKYADYQQLTNQVTNSQQTANKQLTNDQQQLKKVKERKKVKEDTTCAFEAFWEAYPKRKSKGDAMKAWNKINPDSELTAIILNKIARAKTCQDWVKENGRYIPYPATWLNRMGWEDEIGTERKYEQTEDSL